MSDIEGLTYTTVLRQISTELAVTEATGQNFTPALSEFSGSPLGEILQDEAAITEALPRTGANAFRQAEPHTQPLMPIRRALPRGIPRTETNDPTPVELLDLLGRLNDESRLLSAVFRVAMTGVVGTLREDHNFSWREIGKTLQITGESARSKFDPLSRSNKDQATKRYLDRLREARNK